MINKNSPVPLYYQIVEQLKEQIAAGDLASGVRLPSERELSEQAGVSRMTVRQALTTLQRDGLIEVRQGIGAFVTPPKQTYDVLHLLGFSEEIGRRGDYVESVVLEQAIVTPPGRVAQRLALAEVSQTVKITRLRKVNAEPILLETSYLPAARCLGLAEVDLATNSLYQVLEHRYGLYLRRAQQTMECVVATEYEQALFGLREGAPVLLLEGVTYAERNEPVEYFKAIYRGDRCKFQMESWRDSREMETNGGQRVSVVVA